MKENTRPGYSNMDDKASNANGIAGLLLDIAHMLSAACKAITYIFRKRAGNL